MEKIFEAFVATILIFFFSLIVITPVITNIGYSSVQGSYFAVTHSILISLIFTVIFCTMMILEKINKIK